MCQIRSQVFEFIVSAAPQPLDSHILLHVEIYMEVCALHNLQSKSQQPDVKII